MFSKSYYLKNFHYMLRKLQENKYQFQKIEQISQNRSVIVFLLVLAMFITQEPKNITETLEVTESKNFALKLK